MGASMTPSLSSSAVSGRASPRGRFAGRNSGVVKRARRDILKGEETEKAERK
jgi:hypothetical protein